MPQKGGQGVPPAHAAAWAIGFAGARELCKAVFGGRQLFLFFFFGGGGWSVFGGLTWGFLIGSFERMGLKGKQKQDGNCLPVEKHPDVLPPTFSVMFRCCKHQALDLQKSKAGPCWCPLKVPLLGGSNTPNIPTGIMCIDSDVQPTAWFGVGNSPFQRLDARQHTGKQEAGSFLSFFLFCFGGV